jgi:hypothetical protein
MPKIDRPGRATISLPIDEKPENVWKPETKPYTPRPYKEQSKRAELYEPIELSAMPAGVKWKPRRGPPSKTHVVFYSTPGSFYKLMREIASGDVVYFKLKDTGPSISPAERIDAEPVAPKQVRYHAGSHCWFVRDGLWFCCLVVERTVSPATVTLRPVTGWDADRKAQWPHEGDFTFPAKSRWFNHMRPLKARQT